MARVSKPPEIRKQEMIDVAWSLFIEKGYEAVSVRDILDVVKGHPGMFYYYFASKQEIYNEAMRQMIQRELDIRTQIICDKSKPILVRAKEFLVQIQNSISSFYKAFNNPDNSAYQLKVVFDFMTALAEPVSQFMLEATEEGIIPHEAGVELETAYPMALFLIHGCHGAIHIDDDGEIHNNLYYAIPFISRFLCISPEIITP